MRSACGGGAPTAAVTHKGVIRAVLALATGWNMLGKPAYRLDWSAAQLFHLDPAGEGYGTLLGHSLQEGPGESGLAHPRRPVDSGANGHPAPERRKRS